RGISITQQQFIAITDPLARIYAIPDHLHALCNMLGDGLVPSNAKAGYLARMLARRTLRMRDELGIEVSLAELALHHVDVNLGGKNMKQTQDGIATILNLEEEKYVEMLRKGEQVIKTMLSNVDKNANEIEDELLFSLNDSHGIAPEMAISLAHRSGWESMTLRTGFTAELAERHAKMAKDAAKEVNKSELVTGLENLPSTNSLYYDDVYQFEFDASVLFCGEIKGDDLPEGATHAIVLDRTCFYPEGGGQEADFGTLSTDSIHCRVLDTRKIGEHIVHLTDSSLSNGDVVHGCIDWNRRKQLMDHHTSVHIVGGAARKILGPHIYQAGANKSVDSARLDITHYNRLSRTDLDDIEKMANQVIVQVHKTEKSILNRKDADRKHGFDLYQGGAPKGDTIRVLRISDHDVQACGGTHHDELGQIGSIRIVRSTAVQDGVERLHIVAGQAALDFARDQDVLLRQTGDVFGVNINDVPRTAERFFGEWKEQRKRIEQLEAEIVRLRTSGGDDSSFSKDGVRIVIMESDRGLKNKSKMLKELTLDESKPTLAILGSKEGGGKLMVATTENSIASERYNSVEILQSIIP
ncbi:MAG: alanine--tRNA ligase-related protein, partial [Candidatus Thermoplasmatota archaeon]|nr:alanine--tRNA ligase-related protein [Candidatus Thermoplasmatota archaeon]